MECESCGRYRPSTEISSIRNASRRSYAMVCQRCRLGLTGPSDRWPIDGVVGARGDRAEDLDPALEAAIWFG